MSGFAIETHAIVAAAAGPGGRRRHRICGRGRVRLRGTGRTQRQDPQSVFLRVWLADEHRGLAGAAARSRSWADQARPCPSLHQQRQRGENRHAADQSHRRCQGPGPEAVGRGADAGLQRRGAQGRAGGSVRCPGPVLSGRRSRPAAVSVRAGLFHPDSEADLDDLAARSHGAPHPAHRPAFRACDAVLVRRVDRPLRERRHAGGRHHRSFHRATATSTISARRTRRSCTWSSASRWSRAART